MGRYTKHGRLQAATKAPSQSRLARVLASGLSVLGVRKLLYERRRSQLPLLLQQTPLPRRLVKSPATTRSSLSCLPTTVFHSPQRRRGLRTGEQCEGESEVDETPHVHFM